jgi:hypothetical protein
MDVHTKPTPSSSGDPEAPDRTDPYSYKPYGKVDTGAAGTSGAGGASGVGDDATQEHPSPTEALRSAFGRFDELKEYVNLYVAAKTDAFKASMRNVVIFAALGVVGLIAAGAFVVTSVVLLCLGIAHGFAALVGGHLWAGYLIAGVLLLGLLAGGVIVGLKVMANASKKALVKKYELRQRDHRERFGHDAADRAVAAGKVDA